MAGFGEDSAMISNLTGYRHALRAHLHNVTLRHWDPAMRIMGAKALSVLLELCERPDHENALDLEVNFACSVWFGMS